MKKRTQKRNRKKEGQTDESGRREVEEGKRKGMSANLNEKSLEGLALISNSLLGITSQSIAAL